MTACDAVKYGRSCNSLHGLVLSDSQFSMALKAMLILVKRLRLKTVFRLLG